MSEQITVDMIVNAYKNQGIKPCRGAIRNIHGEMCALGVLTLDLYKIPYDESKFGDSIRSMFERFGETNVKAVAHGFDGSYSYNEGLDAYKVGQAAADIMFGEE